MLESDDGDDLGHSGSLLSLGESLRETPETRPSRLSRAIAEVRAERDAASRHRTARSRRNARENPLLAALKNREEPTQPPAEREVAPEFHPAGVDRGEPVLERHEPAVTVDTPPEPTPSPLAPESIAPARAAAWEGIEDSAPADDRRRDDRDANARDPGGDRQWKPLIDPGKVLDGLRRSKRLIIATTLAGALIGLAVAVTTPKTYEASAELLADPRDLNLVEKELTQSGLSNEATLAIVENQVRILTSGTVLSKVVEKLHLDEDPEFNGTARPGGIGMVVQTIRSILSGGDAVDDPGRRSALANENLARSLTVERGGKTFVIVISASTHDGEKSALIANTMTDVFLEAYGQLQSNAAGRAADELTSKLDELRASVEAAERKVETFKAENDIIDAQGRLITDDEIVKLNEQLSIARARTLELNARASSMRAVKIDAVLGGTLPEEIASATIQELRAQYSALKSEADRLDVRLGPRHPQRMAIDAQLEGARDMIAAELKRIVSSTQTELKRAVELEQQMSSRLAQLKVRQGSLSNEMVSLRELERDATAKRAVYEAFLLRARQTGEQRGINSANMSVISKAFPPLDPNPPSRSTIAMTGTLLGLLAGIGLGIARGAWSSLRDTANGGAARVVWRRRRRPDAEASQSHSAAATPPPEDLFPEIQTQPAGEPAQSKDTSMPDPRYADHYGVPQQPQPAAYPQPYGPGAQQMPMQAPFHPYPQPHPFGQAPMPQAWAPPFAPHQGQPMPQYPAGYYWQQPQPQPAAMQPVFYPQQPSYPVQQHPQHYAAAPRAEEAPRQPPPQPAASSADQSPIEEIRASLRECRDAIRDLTESRTRRKYF